jgi:hypothetical protein
MSPAGWRPGSRATTGRPRPSSTIPFDTEANTFSFGDPFRLPEALATTPLRPRTIGLTLRWAPW